MLFFNTRLSSDQLKSPQKIVEKEENCRKYKTRKPQCKAKFLTYNTLKYNKNLPLSVLI